MPLPVSSWILTAMILNAALVAAAIAFALRVAGRSGPDTFDVLAAELEWKHSPPPVSRQNDDADRRLPLFSFAEMRRAEWSALLDAFGAARNAYQRELAAWYAEQPRPPGALARATHQLAVAQRRLTRFEREMTARTAGSTWDATARQQRLAANR
jgi:hypothetical protein